MAGMHSLKYKPALFIGKGAPVLFLDLYSYKGRWCSIIRDHFTFNGGKWFFCRKGRCSNEYGAQKAYQSCESVK